MKAKEAEEDHIALVHTKLHIKLIKDISKKTRGERETKAASFDDIYFNEGSSEAASLAAGSVIEVAEKVANGELDSAFAIVRPPGHHAETDKAMGFCLYNNVAIAASYLLKAEKELGVEKILIVDWDVHHGNGIQQKFWEDPRVLYFSVHRYDSGKFYPMGDGGSSTKRGGGPGVGYNINVPWENGGYGDADYLAVWDHVLIPVAESFNPDLIIISAGFDAALGDPLGGCRVTPDGYALMLSKLMKFAGGKIVMALEGGYNLRSIANSTRACLDVLLYNRLVPEPKSLPLKSTTWKVIRKVRKGFKKVWPVLAEKLKIPHVHILNSDPAAQNHETASTNLPPAGNSASDATETYKHIASKSPSTGPDPPEGQEPENIAIAGPSGGDGPHEAADEINLITVPFKLLNGDEIDLQLSPEETGMELRQRLHVLLGRDIAFTSYALRVRDTKNDSVHCLEHNQTISNVVDISSGEFQLEMVLDHDRDVVGGENEEEQLSPPLVHDVRTSRQRFVDAVTKGAAEIMNGSITPINPTEAQNLRMYVHNNILFSFITDMDMDAYEQSNRESVGTISYDEADDTILNGLMIARVDYRGHRLLAQSIMLAENGGNCFWNGEWTAKEALAEVVKRLHLEELSIRHASTSAFTLAAPAPATSKDIADRQYLWHFPRAPHYANNTGPGSLFRLVRPELIADFCKRRNGGMGLRIEVDDKLIQEAKKFFDDNVILDFITDFRIQDLDTQTLTEKLHSRGINVRDIGKVAEVAEKVVFNLELQHYCSNEIVVRSAKHILKGILRNIEVRDDYHPAVSHFISGLFENGATHVDVSLPDSNEKTTPDSLWSNIRNFAMLKYQYELGEDARSHAMGMKDLMIDKLCQKVGISEPIVSAIVITAKGNVQPEEVQAAKALLCEAVKSYSRALTILNQATSPPIADIASCCRHLARILHCVSNAIIQQEDHPETAQPESDSDVHDPQESGITDRPSNGPGNDESHYELKEFVLAYWYQGIYPAKVLEIYLYKDTWRRYYIAYLKKYRKKAGTKKDDISEDYVEIGKGVYWREWVTAKRLLKANPENFNAMEVTTKKLRDAAKKRDRKKLWIVRSPKPSQVEDPMLKVAEDFRSKFGFELSPTLLMLYIKDQETSRHLGKIIDIAEPLTRTVERIITDYMGPSHDQLGEALRRMTDHFDSQIASVLYESEKYNPPQPAPSRIYGREHLLRMLVTLDQGKFEPSIIEKLLEYLANGEPDVAVEERDQLIPEEQDVAVEEGGRVIPNSMVVDESLPVTTVRISLLDNRGGHHRIRFNRTQTVGDIRRFIDTYVSGPPGMVYRLVAGGEPHRELQDNSETIEDAGLADWGVIQKVLWHA